MEEWPQTRIHILKLRMMETLIEEEEIATTQIQLVVRLSRSLSMVGGLNLHSFASSATLPRGLISSLTPSTAANAIDVPMMMTNWRILSHTLKYSMEMILMTEDPINNSLRET